MNSNYTTSIIYDHRNRASGNKPGQLEIRVTYQRKSIYIGTGVRVHKNEFIAGRIVGVLGAKSLNERLEIIFEKVNDEVNACISEGREVNAEEIRKKILRIIEKNSDEPTFLNWIADQIPLLKIKEGTKKHYVTLQNRLDEYGKMTRWQDITPENIMMFDSWLHSLRPKNDGPVAFGRLGDGLSDGAIYNYHKCLKALLGRADMFGKIERNPYERLRGQFNRGDKENVEYLTEEEMHTIMALEIPEGSLLEKCRDLFVLQMWTGLSYSDAQAFDISQYKNVNGKWINVGERIKTGVPYVSQLLPPVVDVLKKYDWKTPQIENHVYNRMLKAIGAMAGTGTKLHSHLARHSFATYMLSNGTSIEHVGKMLGQSNMKTTQRYAKVLAESVREDFTKIEEKLTKR